jgi:MarR family transcriptional regulator, 2-MHQ and catechol-resistance regulon repressor
MTDVAASTGAGMAPANAGSVTFGGPTFRFPVETRRAQNPTEVRSKAGEMSGDQALSLKLFVILSRAYLAVNREAERDIARHRLSPGQFAILEALYHKGPLLLGEVQRKILASSGGVTYLVDRLETAGLVERRECPGDRRARYAALTKRGQQLMKRIFPDHAAAIDHAVSGLSASEKKAAIDLLRKLGTTAAQLERS